MSSSLTLMGNDITLSLEALQENLKTYKEESQLEDKFFASVAIILTFLKSKPRELKLYSFEAIGYYFRRTFFLDPQHVSFNDGSDPQDLHHVV